MSAPRILVLGGTGYIGGSVLAALVAAPPRGSRIATLTSSASKGDTLRAWAAQQQQPLDVLVAPAASGSEEWYAAARKHASEADVVVQAATSDDLRLTKAINEGLHQARKEGRVGGLVHLSGVQVIESQPLGKNVPTKDFDDASLEDIQGISDDAAHRQIDLEIARAFSAGKLHGSIVCPALVWGEGRGPVSRLSVQLPDMVRKAVYNGAGVYVGEGDNVWVNVHIDECTDLIVKLVEKALSPPSTAPQMFETFYFASHPTLHSFKQLASAIGAALHAEGLAASPEPRSVPCPKWDPSQKGVRVEDAARGEAEAETERSTPIWPSRSNTRCRSNRAKQELGWEPKIAFDDAAMQQDARCCVEAWRKSGELDSLRHK